MPPGRNELGDFIVARYLNFQLELVCILAGEFVMGSDKAKDKDAYDDELPQHKVHLDEYLIGKAPITVAQFTAFARATNYKTTAEHQGSAHTWNGEKWEVIPGANWQHPQGPNSDVAQKQDHPVTCVSWDDALAFCTWLSQAASRTIQLPSEAQWEKAARGPLSFDSRSGGSGDGRIYPWGDEPPDDSRCNFNMNVGDTTPVGKYSPLGDSPYGCADMAGNVWEAIIGACCGVAASTSIRGASAAPPAAGTAQTTATSTTGFVCARSPSTSDLCVYTTLIRAPKSVGRTEGAPLTPASVISNEVRNPYCFSQ